MFRKVWFTAAAVLMMLGLLTGVAFAQAGDVDRGKKLWSEVKLCKNCHGANGEGGLAGPRAGDGKSLEAWITQVRTPRANMPAFNDIKVSDQEIADMWQYMQSLPKPAAFTPTKFELPANAPEGLQLMAQKRCVACHGNGAQLVQFRFTANNRTVDSAAVIKQLRTPFKNMPMFSAAQVTDEQAGQIATYLQSLNKTAAPTTLPVSGVEPSIPIWSISMLVTGFVMLLAGGLTRVRRKA
jgi:mono/diheme cytochrome c family protein